jgi:acyl-CoA synthetase (AMP-forming)/AMP-acid ligase II
MDKHLTDYLHGHAEKTPDKPAVISNERTLSWLQLWQEVEAAAGIIYHQVTGDSQQVVALLMPNCWQFVVAYLGIIHAGHIGMPVDVIYKPLEIDAILEQMRPVLLVTDTPERTSVKIKKLNPSELKGKGSDREHVRLPTGKQIASLVFTSGTTGKPKAAPYTHAGHIWNIEVCSEAWGWNSNDTMLLSLRLSHWYGLCMGLSGVLFHGNTLYLREQFDAQETLQMLSSGKISHFTSVPFVYSEMLKIAGDFEVSRTRLLVSGGAALPPLVWQEFKKRFGVEIVECYGSSETGRIASNTFDERIPGSPGRPLRGVQLKFGPRQEVMVKSPGLFPGYFGNPEATEQSLHSGWWDTGDVGELANGRLVLKGRSQERIRKQGYHISPRDIEWALLKNRAIKDVVVIGMPSSNQMNDDLIYFIVGDIGKEGLKDYVKIALPSVWRPNRVIHLDKIPRTATGKPQLPKLRAML